MKWSLPVLLLFIFSGCAMLGTNLIHSPTSDEGIPWKNRHVHGGATKKAPPDAIIFSVNDSVTVIVAARVIWEKKNFGGVLFPIFPIFWLPKVNYYEDQPNRLIIELSTIDRSTELEIESATIISNSVTFELQEVKKTSEIIELWFPLAAEQTSEFELISLNLIVNEESANLPTITFKQIKQRWRFIGP